MLRTLPAALLGLLLAMFALASSSAGSSKGPSPQHAAAQKPATGTINAENFVSHVDNPWFPLIPGTTYRYRGEKDGKPAVDVFTVTHQTKTIQGVATTVVHDELLLAGKLGEVTTDWYAQDRHGNVWYFGEATKTLDAKGNTTSTEGSFQAGVAGARAGIFFPGDPQVGQTGQQEFFKGQAEDHFEVLSLNTSVSVPYIASSRAVKTKEWTPLEPKVLDNKYYIAGIGSVREISVRGPVERLELVSVQKP